MLLFDHLHATGCSLTLLPGMMVFGPSFRVTSAEDLAQVAQFVRACAQQKMLQPSKSLEYLFLLAESLNDWYQDAVAGWAASLRVELWRSVLVY